MNTAKKNFLFFKLIRLVEEDYFFNSLAAVFFYYSVKMNFKKLLSNNFGVSKTLTP